MSDGGFLACAQQGCLVDVGLIAGEQAGDEADAARDAQKFAQCFRILAEGGVHYLCKLTKCIELLVVRARLESLNEGWQHCAPESV